MRKNSSCEFKTEEYIQFNSKDGKSHNIAQGEGTDEEYSHDHTTGEVESGVFGGDEAYKLKLNTVGGFFFHDHLNPKIIITVLVYSPKPTQ